MSTSRIHISKFSGENAENLHNILKIITLPNERLNEFCEKIVTGLRVGLCNDYTMIWDNYSVGGDQIDYIHRVVSGASESYGRICNSSWRFVFGFRFLERFPKYSCQIPLNKMHKLIFLNAINATALGNDDLLLCIEEVLGPTLQDEDIKIMQKDLFSELMNVASHG